MGRQNWARKRRRDCPRDAVAIVTPSVDNNDIRMCELHTEGRPHRPRWNDETIPKPARAIDHSDAKILGKRRILQPVVHDDQTGIETLLDDGPSSRRAIWSHHDASCPRQQQRFVADVGRPVSRRIDEGRTTHARTVTACEENGREASLDEPVSDQQRQRRLTGPTGRKITNADDRKRAIGARRPLHAILCGSTVKRRRWR
jgi:hypothetical protein